MGWLGGGNWAGGEGGTGDVPTWRGAPLLRPEEPTSTTIAVVPGLLYLCMVVLSLQNATPTPELIRFGYTGPQFRADDIAQITRIADAAGARPWILVGHPGFPPWIWNAQVYLAPDVVGERVRRGRVDTLAAELEGPHAYDRPKTWRSEGTGRYAQIVAPGSSPDALPDARHPSRPFVVHGVVSDEELLEVAALIRSSPTIQSGRPDHPLSEISSNIVHGSWPIGRVDREAPDVVLVWLMLREGYGQTVRLRLNNGSWRIEALGVVVVG